MEYSTPKRRRNKKKKKEIYGRVHLVLNNEWNSQKQNICDKTFSFPCGTIEFQHPQLDKS